MEQYVSINAIAICKLQSCDTGMLQTTLNVAVLLSATGSGAWGILGVGKALGSPGQEDLCLC